MANYFLLFKSNLEIASYRSNNVLGTILLFFEFFSYFVDFFFYFHIFIKLLLFPIIFARTDLYIFLKNEFSEFMKLFVKKHF